MPEDDLLPEGFNVEGEWADTIDDIVWEMSEDGTDAQISKARLQLTGWGFEGSVYRYHTLDDALTVEGLYDIDIEITELGSPDHAVEMASADHTSWLSWQEDAGQLQVDEQIGDRTLAIHTPYHGYGARLWSVHLWVVDGPLVYQFWAITHHEGIPEHLLTLARETIEQE